MTANESTGESAPHDIRSTASDSTRSEPEYTRVEDAPDIVATVAEHLDEYVDELTYLKTSQIQSRVGLSTQQTGSALGLLAKVEDAPVDVENWSQTKYGVTWRIEPAEPQLVTDGGQQFWIVDEERRAQVSGPFTDRVEAQRDDAADEPNNIIVSERALRLAESDGPIRDETGDVDVVTDGGTTDGAIDNEFDEAELSARDQLLETYASVESPTHGALTPGDIAIDMVTRQPVAVTDRVADDLAEYYDREEFDLLNYKQHPWLPVTIDDAVFECVFIGGLDDLHSFSNTYSYPAGRLARVPVELAGGGD